MMYCGCPCLSPTGTSEVTGEVDGRREISRRDLLFAAAALTTYRAEGMEAASGHFATRGIVLTPEDFSLADWPERAVRAGLTTIALHPTPSVVIPFLRTQPGERLMQRCSELGLEIEYELHAIGELLPRALFERDRALFRMDETGTRVRDGNLCVHSSSALDIVAERAVEVSRTLKPTSGRFFYWGDDGLPWCRCPECRLLSDSDQALFLANHMARALRSVWPNATVAHLAYHNTLKAPASVRPEPNVFLEYAPIHRRYDIPFEQQREPSLTDRLEMLDANLDLFPAATAHVLEYWLDASRFAGWKRPAPRLPWCAPVAAADIEAYGNRGIRSVTTFGVYLDADYLAAHGDPPLNAYGRLLCGWRPRAKRPSLDGKRRVDRSLDTSSLVDPFREEILRSGARLPERLEACADPLYGEPAFDPAMIWRSACSLLLEGLPDEDSALDLNRRGDGEPVRCLHWSIRIGLAHIDATFQGDHPKYGVGAYAAEIHDGFPPTILAAVDALRKWDRRARAEALLAYWLRHFVRDDGSIRYYAPSLSEYGQLMSVVRQVLEAGASPAWVSGLVNPILKLARRMDGLTGSVERPMLAAGVPEADTASDTATYFHNNAWLWRGLVDAEWVLSRRLGITQEAEAMRRKALRFRIAILEAIRDVWPRQRGDWWLRPTVERDGTGNMARPVGRVTASRLGSYTNYRYWPELLSSGILSEDLMRRVVDARLTGGGQWLGLTRFEDHADNWPLAHLLDGYWRLRLRSEYAYALWGHILYHQARGHRTAYEQVTLPPGKPAADYCLPAQLVAARGAKRLLRLG